MTDALKSKISEASLIIIKREEDVAPFNLLGLVPGSRRRHVSIFNTQNMFHTHFVDTFIISRQNHNLSDVVTKLNAN
jgi:hypothetical protein